MDKARGNFEPPAPYAPTLLERRLGDLRLLSLQTMRQSVRDYCQRVRSARPWDEKRYPRGTEKELYAQFAHILLFQPTVMIPELLQLLGTSCAKQLSSRLLEGNWRAYRVSTRRRDRGTRWQGPYILPGCAGRGGIADVALLFNPNFGCAEAQVEADLLLYFELKSRDRHAQEVKQLLCHLDALEHDPHAKNAYLGSVGGKPAGIQHPRWLGHVSLAQFLTAMSSIVRERFDHHVLAAEIGGLLQIVSR